MNRFEIIVPCHFGLEAVLKREIIDLGYDISEVEDGRVTFVGDAEAVCRANIFLRSAERVLIKAASFSAVTFDELFEGTKAVQWSGWLPRDGRFWVTKASSVKSALFSPSDIQRIVKKAIVESMKRDYHLEIFPETGASYPIRVFLHKDIVTIGLDTSGESLHKRGYRKLSAKAPISETLASALIMLTPWKTDRILVDPFCGSGTFPIEAAMMAANIAPGMKRPFTADSWENLIPAREWKDCREEARDMIVNPGVLDIQGYDIDSDMVKISRKNASDAGVGNYIHFQQRALKELSHSKKYGFIVTNPPYGERLEEKAALPALYRELGERYRALDSWSAYIITAYEDAERDIGRKADKNRKIYNGMMKTYFYQYLGPKPPKRQNPTFG